MELLIYLTEPPHSSSKPVSALKLGEQAHDRGHEVKYFLMDDGVYCINGDVAVGRSGVDVPSRFRSLIADGVEVAACETAADERGVSSRERMISDVDIEGVQSRSQYKCAQMIDDCDKVVSFIGR